MLRSARVVVCAYSSDFCVQTHKNPAKALPELFVKAARKLPQPAIKPGGTADVSGKLCKLVDVLLSYEGDLAVGDARKPTRDAADAKAGNNSNSSSSASSPSARSPRSDVSDVLFSAIIFVERRSMARLIAAFLAVHPSLQRWLRCSPLTGHGDDSDDFLPGMDIVEQNAIIGKFRTGELNLLVATKVRWFATSSVQVLRCRLRKKAWIFARVDSSSALIRSRRSSNTFSREASLCFRAWRYR